MLEWLHKNEIRWSTDIFCWLFILFPPQSCWHLLQIDWANLRLFQMSASTTATEEDTEQLRDLVAATLEKEGILGKIKAQLRSRRQWHCKADFFKLTNTKYLIQTFPGPMCIYLWKESHPKVKHWLKSRRITSWLPFYQTPMDVLWQALWGRWEAISTVASQHEYSSESFSNFSTWTSVWQFLTQRQTLAAMCNTERELNSALLLDLQN